MNEEKERYEQCSDLKGCNSDVLDLMGESEIWNVQSEIAKALIQKGIVYIETLCSLRLDISNDKDRERVETIMYNISNMSNWFMGFCIEGEELSIVEKLNKELEMEKEEMSVAVPVESIQYECKSIPKKSEIEDINARCIAEVACDFASVLIGARLLDIEEDIEYVFQVLELISKKTQEVRIN